MQLIDRILNESTEYNEETNNCKHFAERLNTGLNQANIPSHRLALKFDGKPNHQAVIINPQYNEETGDFDGEVIEPQTGQKMGNSTKEAIQNYEKHYRGKITIASILPD